MKTVMPIVLLASCRQNFDFRKPFTCRQDAGSTLA